MGCEQFPSERYRENALSFYPSQGLHIQEVMPFREICLGRNHSEDGAKLNMRWMRGVFVGKLDRTDEFLLLTPTGAMKTSCMRRPEGDNAWNLQFLNLCVGSPWNATANTKQSNKRMNWTVADVQKKMYLRLNILDKYGRTAGCPGCLGIGQHTGECRARIEQEMVDKGDAIKAGEEIAEEPDANLKRKIGEPDINPGGASSLTADTPKMK